MPMSTEVERPRAFRREGLATRTAPFIAVGVFGLFWLALKGQSIDGTPIDQLDLFLAFGLVAVLIAAIFLVPWEKLPRWTDAIVPLAYFAVVALMREAEGGRTATTGIFVFLPVVWFALFGSRRELMLSIAGALGVIAVPPLVFGEPNYPLSEVTKAVNLSLVLTMVGFVVYRLVAENTALVADLNDRAHSDPLTGLPNRLAWTGLMRDAVDTSNSTREPLCVAIIDLDGLKAINDRGGHEAGDHALIDASNAWAAAAPEGGTLARLGGDEFALLLPGFAELAAAEAVEALRQGADPHPCSIGLALHNPPESPSAFLRRADQALYVAKSEGGNRTSNDADGAPVFAAV